MKKIISLLVSALLVFLSLVGTGVLAAEGITQDVLVEETFNSYANGSTPKKNFSIKRAGSGDMSIVEVPDAVNKSLRMSCGTDGAVHIEKEVLNPEKVPLNLSFRFKLGKKSNSSLINVADAIGTSYELFEITENNLMQGESVLTTFEKGRWYYAEISFNIEGKSYSLSIDNNKLIRKEKITFTDIASVRIGLSQTNQEINLDDVLLCRADIGVTGQEYFRMNELFVSPIQHSSVEDIALDSFLMYQNSAKALKNGVELMTATPPREFNKIMYLPLRFAAENMGAEVIWNDEEKVTFLVFAENTYKIKPGESRVCANGEPLNLTAPIMLYNGSTYIPAQDLCNLLNQTLLCEDGFIMIGGIPQLYEEADKRVKMEVRNIVKYQRPTGQQMYDALISRYPNDTHPRLHGDAAAFERVKELIKTDEIASKMYEFIKKTADSYLDMPVSEYTSSFSTEDEAVQDRTKELAFMWRITGESKYAERAWKEIEAALNFPKWDNPTSSSVDVLTRFHISQGLAVAYDWMYDWIQSNLSQFEIDNYLKTLYERNIVPALQVYRGEINSLNSLDDAYFWATDELNFNPAGNEAVLTCCFILAERYPEDCIAAMNYAMRGIEFHFDEFVPDGAWTEGPDYGSATVNMDARLISAIESALGTEYGLGTLVGLSDSAYFQQYILGPTGFFNYSDSNKIENPEYNFSFYYAKHLNDPALGYYRLESLKKSGYDTCAEEMLWYSPDLVGNSAASLDKDRYFRKAETALLRSDWSNDAIFAGLHAHDNAAIHGQLDVGTFVLDAFNTEWFRELGYDPIAYTDAGANFEAYRSRGEGHNTLVIDETPYNALETDSDGWIKYENFDFNTLTLGEAPTVFRTSLSGGATASIEQDLNSADNRFMRMSCPEAEKTVGAFHQHIFLEPHIKHGIKYSFKVRLSDVSFLSETKKETGWRFPEVNDSNGNYFFPIQLTKDGFGAVDKNGWNDILLGIKPNLWYNITMELDIDAQKYSVSVDGGKEGGRATVNNLVFSKDIANINTITFSIDNAKVDVDYDDISILLSPDDSNFGFYGVRALDQNRYAKTYISEYETKSQGSFAKVDMTEAYQNWADSAVRGLMLTDQRRAVVLRDEVKLKKKSDIYWSGHIASETNAKIAPDGKSAILKKKGQRLWVGIISDNDAVFQIMDAKPLPGSPNPESQQTNVEYKKLAIKFTEVEEMNLSVAMIPLLAGEETPRHIPEETSLSDWEIPADVLPEVDSILINGALVEGFNPTKNLYDVLLPEEVTSVPIVSATASGAVISIKQASEVPGYAVITVEKDGLKSEYVISFRIPEVITSTIQGYSISSSDITVSEMASIDKGPEATIDDNLFTRWQNEGTDEWIVYDFRQTVSINKLDMAWFYGEQRKYKFTVEFSNDLNSWTRAFVGETSGTTSDIETFDFGKTYSGRYMRITCNGHNSGTVNHLAEVR